MLEKRKYAHMQMCALMRGGVLRRIDKHIQAEYVYRIRQRIDAYVL